MKKIFIRYWVLCIIFVIFYFSNLFAQNFYFNDEIQKFSTSSYKQGLKYASEGKIKDAKESFKRALQANEFSSDAINALKMIEFAENKPEQELTVRTFFSSILLGLELQEIKNQIVKLSSEFSNLKQKTENIYVEFENFQINIENKILNIKNDIDKLENDIDYLKNTIRSR
ncbi:MAG: DUF5082 domain-containing protein [Candidatus Omnitrophica bacterium]|nr:DUF5082 domain-containing protein [Candidatus Omnitrophota bacterium]